MITPNMNQVDLTKEEARLIEELREMKWGEAIVKMKNGKPVMLRAAKDVKLTE